MSLTEQKRILDLTMQYVRGFPIPKRQLFNPEYIEQAMDYEPHEDDVILFAYAKTGSTWLLYVVWNIVNKCEKSITDLNEIEVVETSGKDAIDRIPKPRLYKYHLPADRIRISKKAKYIYVYRDPADVLVSYYHFTKGTTGQEFDFDPFYEAFIAGKVPFDDYLDHVLAAYRHKDDDNFLLLAYEDSKRDSLGEVLKIAKFLGGDYYQPFLDDPHLAEKIVKLTSFDRMKKDLTFSDGSDKEVKQSSNMDYFFRKGVVGDGKAVLSEEQKKRLNEMIKFKTAGTDLLERWLIK